MEVLLRAKPVPDTRMTVVTLAKAVTKQWTSVLWEGS